MIVSIAGALAFGSKAGIAAVASINLIPDSGSQTISAFIDGSDVTAAEKIELSAMSSVLIVSVSAALSASPDGFAAVVAVAFNRVSTNTATYIKDRKTARGVSAADGISLTADDNSNVVTIADGIGIRGGQAGVGASLTYTTIANHTRAYIDSSTVDSSNGNIEIRAMTDPDITAIAVGGGVASKIGVSGSAAVGNISNTTETYIKGTSSDPVTAKGNILIASESTPTFVGVAGSLAVGGLAGIGAALVTFITNNSTLAYIGDNASVTARGNGGNATVAIGQAGERTTDVDLRGLSVTAHSFQDVTLTSFAGAGGAKFGVAGSATVTLMDETVRAFIGHGATINGNDDGSASQDVNVFASNETDMLGLGGGIAIGGKGGVGAGADVGIIDKTTEAFINATTVNAKRHVFVQAVSEKTIISVAASGSGGAVAAVAGAAGVNVMSLITQAYIGDGSNPTTVDADGSVVVAANATTTVDMVGGNITGSSGASVGGAAAIGVIDKVVDAHIGAGAIVNAKGRSGDVTVNTGDFDDTTYIADPADNEREVSVKTGSIDPSDANDNSITSDRTIEPSKNTRFRGISVTAVNRDDIESAGVGVGVSGNVAVQVSASANVLTTNVSAYVGNGAQVTAEDDGNADNGGPSVQVAAGNDYYHLGIAGAGAISGNVSVTPGADVAVVNNTTTAYIGANAQVRSERDVLVHANAQEKILSVSATVAGSATAGAALSVSFLYFNNTTSAFIDSGAVVDAQGNVLVAARDVTETDIIAGSIGVGVTGGAFGGAGGVNVINKTTTAYINDNATVDAWSRGRSINGILSGDISGDNLTKEQRFPRIGRAGVFEGRCFRRRCCRWCRLVSWPVRCCVGEHY